MKSVRKNFKKFYIRKFFINFLMCCLILNTSLSVTLALESGDVLSSSGATPTQWGDHTIIDTDHGAIIDWSNFNTGDTQSVTFNQYLNSELSSSSAVLNRVSSGTVPTQFNGDLNANGRVFVVNPAGIIFGFNSTVNVTQLVASGLKMSNEAFNAVLANPANQMVFEGGDGEVRNNGKISADSVFFIGNKVINIGGVMAPSGLVVMAAGDNVYLAQDGSNVLVEITADPGNTTPDVSNRGLVSARHGSIVLAAGDTFSRAIENVGIITAHGFYGEGDGGTITARAARIDQQGIIKAEGYALGDGSGGSISLTGTEEVVVANPGAGTARITTNAGLNGNGGQITLQSEGTVTVDDSALIEAHGGSTTGDGGSIKITCEHFTVTGDIDASPLNADFEPGTLWVDPVTVTIADGDNLGELDTIYEEDIEALSEAGTNLIVEADDSITMENIDDDEITGGFGDIELHATGDDSFVYFKDKSDTIRTTLGDIVIEAGGGGIDIGSLITSKDLSDDKPTPGQIMLTTENGGDITTEDLLIESGWGHAKIYANASGDLTVNGDVYVGSDPVINPIQNIPNGQNAEAMIRLMAGDNVVLNGDVGAYASGTHEAAEGGVTKAYVGVYAGMNQGFVGHATINGDLEAIAKSASQGTSEATIEVSAWGDITFGSGAAAPLADGDNGQVHVQSYQSETDEDNGDVARIIINAQHETPPPGPPIGVPDFTETHMGNLVEGDVLKNDFDPEGHPLTATLVDGPTHHESFTLNPDGSYSYKPKEGYVGKDSFTYTATDDEQYTTDPVTVIITMTNNLPTLTDDVAATDQYVPVVIDVLANDSDLDGDPLKVDSFAYKGTGTLVLNPDGTFTYTSTGSFTGEESFTYYATDPQVGAEPAMAKVTITVKPGVVPPGLIPMPWPVAPGLERAEIEISGCPALMKWAAEEIGTDERVVQIWMVNALASTRNIQPCDMCANLRHAAIILQDAEGIRIAALAQIVNEFASSTAPPTEEQMASIADAIARSSETNSHYFLAGEYLDALVEYVGILNSELNFSMEESIEFATEKYIGRLTQSENVSLAAFIAARLAALGG